MPNVTASTFPGVYSRLTDSSYTTEITSRYRPALIGVAEKGPFDTVVKCRSSRDFVRQFGKAVAGRYVAHYASMLGDMTDGLHVVRVGHRYTPVLAAGSGPVGSGAKSSTTLNTAYAPRLAHGSYVRVTQPGKVSTVGAQVTSVQNSASTSVTLDVPLNSDYSTAAIDICDLPGAANEAETLLWTYTYEPVTMTVSGDKSTYELIIETGDVAAVDVGDVLLISKAGNVTTREVRVKSKIAAATGVSGDAGKARLLLETSNNSEKGYQALSLQDTYSGAAVSRVIFTGSDPNRVATSTVCLPLLAASAGTWANSDGVKTGLIVKVSPGSKPDTKKLLVYDTSVLVETLDNLSTDVYLADGVTPNPNYYPTKIAKSAYIAIPGTWTDFTKHPANTVDAWGATTSVNIAYFLGGANGDSPAEIDYIGTVDPVTDVPTGLKCFEDDNVDVTAICAPDLVVIVGDGTDTSGLGVLQEIARIARNQFSAGLCDVPDNLTLRQATDFHNGTGLYSDRGALDTYALAMFWNWGLGTDRFNGGTIWLPPSYAAMRAQAYTFDAYNPWWIAAGQTRGLVPELTKLRFEVVSKDAKAASYGDSNSINSVLRNRGTIMVYGDRTMQRAESKLTALHSVCLTNWIMKNMDAVSQSFVFDPDDATMLSALRMRLRAVLEIPANARGLEDYSLTVDDTNNNADTRNRREAIVDVSYIPVDGTERIYLNATCRESGAVLNKIS